MPLSSVWASISSVKCSCNLSVCGSIFLSLSLSHTLGVCVCVCAVCAFFYKLFSSHMAAAFICAMWLVSNALSDSKRFEVAWRSGSASGSKGGSMGATTMGGLDRCIRLAFWQFAHTHTHKMCINFMDKNSKLHRKLRKRDRRSERGRGRTTLQLQKRQR